MKPRTKLEKEVVRLSHNLCPRKRELKRAVKNLQNETPNNYYHVIAEVKGGYQVFRFFRIRIYKYKPANVRKRSRYGTHKEGNWLLHVSEQWAYTMTAISRTPTLN